MWILAIATWTALLGAMHFALLQVPFELTQGAAQKIFYFHVPSAFSLYIFASLGVIFSGIYLAQRQEVMDRWARASFYTSTFFAILVLGSGPIWAKPIWGVYWTWDPRLTLSFILFILLLGYCFSRNLLMGNQEQRHRGAVVGSILGVLTVPFMLLTHFSVKLWRGLHPSVLRESDGLDPQFRLAFEWMLLAMFVFATLIFLLIYRGISLSDRVRHLEEKIWGRSQKGSLS